MVISFKEFLRRQEIVENKQTREYNEKFVKEILEAEKRGNIEPIDDIDEFYDKFK